MEWCMMERESVGRHRLLTTAAGEGHWQAYVVYHLEWFDRGTQLP